MTTTNVVASRHLSATNAATVVDTLRSIQSQGLPITAKTLLDASRSKTSPTHPFFEWDDSKAAEQHRLSRASELIREVQVEIRPSPNDKARRVRAYVSVVQSHGRSYEETAHVLSKAELREQLLEEALRTLRAFEKRYKDLTELAQVFEALARVKRKAAARRKTAKAAA